MSKSSLLKKYISLVLEANGRISGRAPEYYGPERWTDYHGVERGQQSYMRDIEMGPSAPFKEESPGGTAVKNPFDKETTIIRDFALFITPELAKIIGYSDEEYARLVADNDLVDQQKHEVLIGFDATWSPEKFHGSHEQPPDGDDFELNDWLPLEIDGVALSEPDAHRLKDFLGDLTSDDEEAIIDILRNEHDEYFEEPDDY